MRIVCIAVEDETVFLNFIFNPQKQSKCHEWEAGGCMCELNFSRSPSWQTESWSKTKQWSDEQINSVKQDKQYKKKQRENKGFKPEKHSGNCAHAQRCTLKWWQNLTKECTWWICSRYCGKTVTRCVRIQVSVETVTSRLDLDQEEEWWLLDSQWQYMIHSGLT